MEYFQKTWPNVLVTPKLQMLESHASDFIKRWGTGFGMYGEQGLESLHAAFNNLQQTHCRMKSNSHRLQCMMREHLARIHPAAKQLRPEVKKESMWKRNNRSQRSLSLKFCLCTYVYEYNI